MNKKDSTFHPAWPAASDPVMRRPLDGLDRVWITARPVADLLDLGNAAYGTMLAIPTQTFWADSPDRQRRQMDAVIALMEVVSSIGSALARLPTVSGQSNLNAGITFAMPRNRGIRPATSDLHLLERLDELRDRATSIAPNGHCRRLPERFQAIKSALEGAG